MGKIIPKILLIGGGGHCHSVIDTILSSDEYHAIGVIDQTSCDNVMGIPVVGRDEDLPELYKQGWTHAFVTLGSIGNPVVRRKLYRLISDIGFSIPNIIDSSAVVAPSAVLDRGIFIGKRTVVNANSQIGTGVIINTGSIIEHDCKIGAFAHISPGAVLCGNVRIESDAHIGAGTVVKQSLYIGRTALVGAGSVVVRDIPERTVAYGNPCRVVRSI